MSYNFLRFPGFKQKAVTLSYDDGVRGDIKLVKILNEYGLKCTFNVNSGMFAKREGLGRLTESEARELYSSGVHEVAAHGYMHLPLTEVPEDAGIRDVLKDREILENMFGVTVKGFAYPNGVFNDRIADTLKRCGIKYARTCVPTKSFDIPEDWLQLKPTCHHNEPELQRLIEEFLAADNDSPYWSNHRPKLFYLWGHTYQFDGDDNWNVMEDFAQKVGNRDDVWYATNGEIYDYVQAYNGLEYSADGKIVRNPSCTDVYLYYYGKDLLVKSGQTVTVRI